MVLEPADYSWNVITDNCVCKYWLPSSRTSCTHTKLINSLKSIPLIAYIFIYMISFLYWYSSVFFHRAGKYEDKQPRFMHRFHFSCFRQFGAGVIMFFFAKTWTINGKSNVGKKNMNVKGHEKLRNGKLASCPPSWLIIFYAVMLKFFSWRCGFCIDSNVKRKKDHEKYKCFISLWSLSVMQRELLLCFKRYALCYAYFSTSRLRRQVMNYLLVPVWLVFHC